MKNTPADILQTQIDTFTGLVQDAESLCSRLSAETAELNGLSANGDLNDEKVLSSIARLQTFTTLLPTRITAREAAADQAEKDLLAGCHNFITKAFSPRTRELADRTRENVRASLKHHFRPDQLDHAIEQSEQVIKIETLRFALSVRNEPAGQIVAYANRALDYWNQVEAFAAKH